MMLAVMMIGTETDDLAVMMIGTETDDVSSDDDWD